VKGEIDVERICITGGGEPLCYPDLVDLTALAMKTLPAWSVSIVTSGVSNDREAKMLEEILSIEQAVCGGNLSIFGEGWADVNWPIHFDLSISTHAEKRSRERLRRTLKYPFRNVEVRQWLNFGQGGEAHFAQIEGVFAILEEAGYNPKLFFDRNLLTTELNEILRSNPKNEEFTEEFISELFAFTDDSRWRRSEVENLLYVNAFIAPHGRAKSWVRNPTEWVKLCGMLHELPRVSLVVNPNSTIGYCCESEMGSISYPLNSEGLTEALEHFDRVCELVAQDCCGLDAKPFCCENCRLWRDVREKREVITPEDSTQYCSKGPVWQPGVSSPATDSPPQILRPPFDP